MSAKGKPTSGPWKVYHELLRPQFRGNKIIEIQDNDGNAIVKWSGFDDSNRLKKTHLANARLMAAAPTMLRALTAASHALKSYAHGNASPDLAASTATFVDEAIKAAGGEVINVTK